MRYFGKVGYATTTERIVDGVHTSIWEDVIVEREYYGDVIKPGSRWQASENLNDDLRVTNQISVLADAFAYQNFSKIKYVDWMGVKWKVTNISVERPRLVLTLGGEYNGDTPTV